ncbi:MAG: B12-binding domain-containing radical SAM protein [Syntrophaceae bacterium]|nr:B12-binding domain-containing radical SAM protein [Syntrophaceae bacterium]
MSKILLIKPRFLAPEFQTITQPMGLMYIGAALKNAGHEPKIHDCVKDYKNLNILRRTIKDWKPDFIGISIIVTEIEKTKKIMGIIRQILPNVPVTFGGPWPSANPEESIKILGADFVVIGEGELVFSQLVDVLNKGLSTESISGTASMVDGQLKINPGRYLTEDELNALPFPTWELLDHKLYAKMPSGASVGCRPYMAIVTSRGCPFKCSYCHRTMGEIFRKRTAESVLAEMEELRWRHGFREFEIIDDSFNIDRGRTYEILTGIRERLGGVKLHFSNGLRADMLEPEEMSLYKKAGTVSAGFAIETSSPRLQKMIHKNLDINKAIITINAAVRAGIYSTGYFMIGFPTESYEEASATVEFADRSTLHRASFMLVTPFAGTELAEIAADILKRKDNAMNPRETTYFTSSFNVSAMSDRDLQRVFRRAYWRFYLNPKRLIQLVIYHPKAFSLLWYAFIIVIWTLPKKRRSS